MKSELKLPLAERVASAPWRPGLFLASLFLLLPAPAQASMFQGEALDKAADVLTWAVLVIAPVVGITVFWLLHILPEKIAHKKKHPQTAAIQTLCLLSLFFGGLLWPIAWLWAYSKPVLHKMAYGTDVDESLAHGHEAKAADKAEELKHLRAEVAKLEAELSRTNPPEGGKA
jgi:CBS domain containing-hemolysin-like protein